MSNAKTKFHDLFVPAGLGTTEWRTVSFATGEPIALAAAEVTSPIGTSITGIGLLIVTDNAANRATFVDAMCDRPRFHD